MEEFWLTRLEPTKMDVQVTFANGDYIGIDPFEEDNLIVKFNEEAIGVTRD